MNKTQAKVFKRKCAYCGKDIITKHVTKRYCSSYCNERHRHFFKKHPKEWELTREHILERYNYKCAVCGKKGKLYIHHIQPIALRGDNTENNLISLCIKCHGKIHKAIIELLRNNRNDKKINYKNLCFRSLEILQRERGNYDPRSDNEFFI